MHSEIHELLKSRLFIQSAITNRLNSIGCMHWNTTINKWLVSFDGLEQFYDNADEKSPCEQVLDALEEMPSGVQVSDTVLADTLVHLDFLNMRIKHPKTNERWNSLNQSLVDFLQGESGPIAYVWDSSWPATEDIVEWLIASSKTPALENHRI